MERRNFWGRLVAAALSVILPWRRRVRAVESPHGREIFQAQSICGEVMFEGGEIVPFLARDLVVTDWPYIGCTVILKASAVVGPTVGLSKLFELRDFVRCSLRIVRSPIGLPDLCFWKAVVLCCKSQVYAGEDTMLIVEGVEIMARLVEGPRGTPT